MFQRLKLCSYTKKYTHSYCGAYVGVRNQTGVYERTLHDREIDSTNSDESFEINDEAVG